MLRSVKELVGYSLLASDGEIGACKDFLFDDRDWVVRYMVADTRRWLPGRTTLISPASLGEPDWGSQLFPVNLSQEEIRRSPPLEENAPVSRQYERTYHEFFGFGFYWEGGGLWGGRPDPEGIVEPASGEASAAAREDIGEGHVRSMQELRGYDVHASDDAMGQVEDFVVEDSGWTIEWLVVDTHKWLPGRKVLVSPEWISAVSWADRRVDAGLTAEQIRNSPPYDPNSPINREYEDRLYDFYGRPRMR